MKNIVITGASRGIGLELAKQFSEDNFVYVLCRSEFPSEALNDNIRVVKLDVSDEAAIKNFAGELDGAQVPVDLLINNAGIDGGDENGDVSLDAESVTKVFATNTVAPMMMSLHLAAALKRANVPVMIAVSSYMGTHAQLNEYNATWWPYSASKAALSFAVSSFALNEPSIKSISVHPGWVKTRMGGEGAQVEPSDSAKAIRNLYESIDELETGMFYNYDGSLLPW